MVFWYSRRVSNRSWREGRGTSAQSSTAGVARVARMKSASAAAHVASQAPGLPRGMSFSIFWASRAGSLNRVTGIPLEPPAPRVPWQASHASDWYSPAPASRRPIPTSTSGEDADTPAALYAATR